MSNSHLNNEGHFEKDMIISDINMLNPASQHKQHFGRNHQYKSQNPVNYQHEEANFGVQSFNNNSSN
jgi:hypothetical protein